MGGTITIILRKPDGTEYRMQRWTNIMPYFLNNIRLVEENENHIEAFLKQWLSMKEDYERHKEDKQFEHNMTDVYFPLEGLVPCEYGIIVIDMKTKVILDCFQNYQSIGILDAIQFVDLFKNRHTYSTPEEIENEIVHLKEPFDKKRIRNLYIQYRNERNLDVKVPIPLPSTFDEFITLMELNTEATIELDMSPYTIERYELNEIEKALARIKSLGFILTPEEEGEWQKQIKETKEYNGGKSRKSNGLFKKWKLLLRRIFKRHISLMVQKPIFKRIGLKLRL